MEITCLRFVKIDLKMLRVEDSKRNGIRAG
jgi:hypothetical protein